MSEINMFEAATRNKMRFTTSAGQLTVEDLWDLPLTGSRVSLDSIAKEINKQIKAEGEESFVSSAKKNTVQAALVTKLDIVKYVIKTKEAEAAVAKSAREKRERNARIMELIAQKQDQDLAGKSIEELTKLLEQD